MPENGKPLTLVARLPAEDAASPALDTRPDDELMQLAAAGVLRAFEALTRRHQSALRTYCARRCGVGLGDEVAQEVLLALWNARADYQPRGQFRAYLFTLAERRCDNAARGQRRHALRHERVEPKQAAETPLDVLLAGERQRRLFALVDDLSSEQRRAILLRYAAGLDYEDIAVLTRRGTETVRSRVFLGLKQLRKRLGKRGET